METIFRLPHPVLQQTHGRITTRFQQFGVEAAKVVYEIGKVVSDEFTAGEGAELVTRVLDAEQLELIYAYAQSEGQPPDQRGQVRDSDFGAFLAGGNGF